MNHVGISFEGKVALVTGASKGLGKDIVSALCRSGANVLFTFRNSRAEADALSSILGGQAVGMQADASDSFAAEVVVSKTIEAFGTIDILINNASSAKHAGIDRLSIDDWNFTLQNTLTPVFLYTKAVIPHFKEKKHGKIINIGSINGLRGREGSAAYAAAKSGLVGFTKTCAKELGKYHINCNLVAPGYIDTDGQANTSELIKKMVLDECCIRELTKPEDITNLVLFLASSYSDAITGEVYRIGYGQYL